MKSKTKSRVIICSVFALAVSAGSASYIRAQSSSYSKTSSTPTVTDETRDNMVTSDPTDDYEFTPTPVAKARKTPRPHRTPTPQIAPTATDTVQ